MENNNTVQNVVHGFKVFRHDWTCSPNGNTKQYTTVTVCTSVRLLPTASIITVSTVKTRLQKSLPMVR